MSTTKNPDSPEKTNDGSICCTEPRHKQDKFYTELARIIAGLFVGLLALMTFLLTVGFPRPHEFFAWSLYASIVTLALNLVVYALSHAVSSEKALKIVRIVQQGLFVVAVVAITCLAIATANFFFAIPATASSGAAPVTQ